MGFVEMLRRLRRQPRARACGGRSMEGRGEGKTGLGARNISPIRSVLDGVFMASSTSEATPGEDGSPQRKAGKMSEPRVI